MRWVYLLSRLKADEAQSVIRHSPEYADLTITLYASALEWLREIKVVVEMDTQLRLTPDFAEAPMSVCGQLLFERALVQEDPAWLDSADLIVDYDDDLPADAATLAAGLDLNERAAAVAVRRVYGHMDLKRRAEVGAAGERGLVALLEAAWPNSADHIALRHDGFGYDIAVTLGEDEWHLEVKSTSRRGRLVIHLSRQEFEVGRHDPQWRLVVVGLDEMLRVGVLATVNSSFLREAPVDRGQTGRWTAAQFELSQASLTRGVPFLPSANLQSTAGEMLRGGLVTGTRFTWWPAPDQRAAMESSSNKMS